MTTLPDFDAANFTDPAVVDNPYFPLPPGTINSYEAEIIDPDSGEDEIERNDHFAAFPTKMIEGIEVAVVRDTAYEDGFLVEDTLDWYAQDNDGNVWYLGEIAVNYNYDDDDEFIGTDFDGSWEAGVDGAVPGYIMLNSPMTGDSYFQEFYAGVAEDEGEVVDTGLSVAGFNDVIKILDTSALEPESAAFKFFAPGVGMVFEEEIATAEPDVPELVLELTGIRMTDMTAPVDPAELAFAGDGTEQTVTFLTEDGSVNGAIGAYVFDTATGEIGEGRILLPDTEDVEAGETASVMVGTGQSLGLFLIPDVEEVGVDLEEYVDGGLFFGNLLGGEVADIYDGDPSTTYTPGPATIHDGLAPVVMDADGNLLPLRPYHAAGNREGFNFLNQVAGENAQESTAGDLVAGATVISFEDGLATTDGFDGDFDDAFVAVSDGPLSDADLGTLLGEIGISRVVGTDCADRLRGTDEDDQIIALDGNDRIVAGAGDDIVEGSDGNDRIFGMEGDDQLDGEDGNDRLYGRDGEDELEGGEGNDTIFGGNDADEIDGDEGNDSLFGGAGFDEVDGGEGNDRMVAGADGALMIGGAGNDRMFGEAGAADVFFFDLIPFGHDRIYGFEDGTDLIQIATYIEVEAFGDIGVAQMGTATQLSFADGSVMLEDTDAALIDAADFAFV
ncbi:MAG: hypothetical protein OEN23_15245 [Paracoccaceae bacterium]|nr:hypothetical protein [Paracoccaceae bacterium]